MNLNTVLKHKLAISNYSEFNVKIFDTVAACDWEICTSWKRRVWKLTI